eukprot:jgi/Tetstr1/458196/TSEL_044686.t1
MRKAMRSACGFMIDRFGVRADTLNINKDAERGPSKKEYLACYRKFFHVIAIWMIDSIEQSQWAAALGEALEKASQEWLRAFMLVPSSKDVTPTMHTVVDRYGDLVQRLCPIIVHCRKGMEHKHKPAKRERREPTNYRDYNSEYCSPFSTVIIHCSIRLLAKHWVHVTIHGADSNTRRKHDAWATCVDRLNTDVISEGGNLVTETKVRNTYAGKPVKARRDSLLDEVARMQNEWLDKMHACGWDINHDEFLNK